MGLVSRHGDEYSPISNAHEEKILVSIRLRPLNEKEVAQNDIVDWECINNTTLLSKNGISERQNSPTAYSFDRVFGSDCCTKQVYDEAAKSVALSVVSGINSSVFAYGQTSSGKTYTMSGITEYTIADIYDYTDKNTSRKFNLKFSAMEIYNEAVRDLLSSDGTPLRLLDDPERGTVVERLTEVTLKDRSHLGELLSVCAAQRKVGETALNEVSSRSHQILRLTVESSPREYNRFENSSSLAATVNFIDLAGSERASQTMSAGTRLKEGSHINRSLLTLGTVIRKLSKSKNGHVPYRDSKLTRILQNSLGGNARTAIICTMSPAHIHVEQSRNTLLFATCAKQVSTNAHVNVMMSEKSLIKQLQRELARLENQLKNLGSVSTSGDSFALKEKELLIEKMEKEIRDLTQQRDQAHFRLHNFVQPSGENQRSKQWDEQSNVSEPQEKMAWFEEYAPSETSETADPFRFDAASSVSHFSERNLNKHDEQFPEPSEEQFFSDDTSPRLFMERYFGPDPTKGWEKTAHRVDAYSEDTCKEVQCVEIETPARKMSLDALSSMGNEDQENANIHYDNGTSKPKLEDPQKTHKFFVGSEHPEPEPSLISSDSESAVSRIGDLPRSKSSAAIRSTMPLSPTTEMEKEDDSRSVASNDSVKSLPAVLTAKEDDTEAIVVKDGDRMVSELQLAVDGKDHQRDHSLESLDSDSMDDKEQIIISLDLDDKVKYERQFRNDLVPEAEPIFFPNKLDKDSAQLSEGANGPQKSWPEEFEKQRAEIIQLWEACHIPLVHRTYFYLVFNGDPSDAIYMEVELRRLSYLKDSQGGPNGQASSLKEMNRERHMLSKLMLKKLSTKEREELFQKWGVGLRTKRRRLQLCRKLWTSTKDMEHINESSALIAKLVGLVEPGQVPKEIVGLSFSTPQINVRSFSWKPSLPSLV